MQPTGPPRASHCAQQCSARRPDVAWLSFALQLVETPRVSLQPLAGARGLDHQGGQVFDVLLHRVQPVVREIETAGHDDDDAAERNDVAEIDGGVETRFHLRMILATFSKPRLPT